MATAASIPPYMLPGVTVQQPSHLEGDANLATEILPGPPSIASVQQAAQKRDPKKPSTIFSYLPSDDPGSTYSGIAHGTLIGQEPQDGHRPKRPRVDKGTASGRAQRASARNQNGQTVAVPLESTGSGEAPAHLHPIPSPMETDSLPGVPEDEPSLSRSNSSSNFNDFQVSAPHGRPRRKDKGKAKEVDPISIRVKEEPKSVVLPSPDPPLASNLLNNDDHCSSCRSHGDLVYCDGCPRAFHLWCVDPPLEAIEEGDSRWFCPGCMIRKQPPAKPPPSLLSPLIHQLNMSIPVEFQLPEDIRTFFKDVGQGPKGNYIDTTFYKPPRQSRLGLPEERDAHRLRDKNGAPVLCFQCGVSALPSGLATTAPATKRTRRSSFKGASDDSWKPIISCDFCTLHWHLDCLDPPLPSLPPLNRRWMCPNHSDRVLPIKRRIPKYNPYPVIEIDRPGQSNNGNIEIIPSENAVPIQQGNRIATDEVLINGRRYRVPERTIVLDFWSKLSKRSASPHQEEKDNISSAMSSPLTSLSSLDDFGDDSQEIGSVVETDELKVAEMLHSLRRRRSHASNLNGISRRKMFERAVQTSPDVEASDSSGSRNINSSAPTKRLTKAATINGVTRQNTLTDLTSTSATPIPTVIITQRKHSVQSTQPESVRELRSKSRNVVPESSSASVPSGENAISSDSPSIDTAVTDASTIVVPSKKAVQVKVEESEDPLTLSNGVPLIDSPTINPKTPPKRRGRRPIVKDTEEGKPAPAKRGRKRKEREEDLPYRPKPYETSKKEKLDLEEKEKRSTRKRIPRTPSRSRVLPVNPTSIHAPASAPVTPSLKIRLPRFNVGSISATNPGGTGSQNKL